MQSSTKGWDRTCSRRPGSSLGVGGEEEKPNTHLRGNMRPHLLVSHSYTVHHIIHKQALTYAQYSTHARVYACTIADRQSLVLRIYTEIHMRHKYHKSKHTPLRTVHQSTRKTVHVCNTHNEWSGNFINFASNAHSLMETKWRDACTYLLYHTIEYACVLQQSFHRWSEVLAPRLRSSAYAFQ